MKYTVHVHNERVGRWVSQLDAARGRDRTTFATCPITELGFVRVSSGKAAYAKSVDAARDDLEDLKSSMGMRTISPRGTFRCAFAIGAGNGRLSSGAGEGSRRLSCDVE